MYGNTKQSSALMNTVKQEWKLAAMRLKSHAVVTMQILAASPGDISVLYVGYFIHCQNFAFSAP
jgi:hypothetical protein